MDRFSSSSRRDFRNRWEKLENKINREYKQRRRRRQRKRQKAKIAWIWSQTEFTTWTSGAETMHVLFRVCPNNEVRDSYDALYTKWRGLYLFELRCKSRLLSWTLLHMVQYICKSLYRSLLCLLLLKFHLSAGGFVQQVVGHLVSSSWWQVEDLQWPSSVRSKCCPLLGKL